MGLVYKAHDAALDEVVAIKVLRAQLLDNQLMRQRFLSEIKLARRVTHKNVCRIHDYGEDGPVGYISMQFVEGAELKTLVRQSPGLSIDEAFEIAIQLADGLQAIHDEGIIHRDFKPANVMVDARGHPRIMDFGIAKLWDSAPADGPTLPGYVTGTPEYMSPEQATGDALDPRSDIYSLGIVLFELFTGSRPFTADNIAALLHQQIYVEPPIDAPIAAAMPAPVKPIVRKALAKFRNDRFTTADELKRALLDARAALAPRVHDSTDTIVAKVQSVREAAVAPHERPRRISRRAWWQLLTAGSVAAVLVTVISAANLFTRRAPTPDIPQPTGVDRPLPPTQAPTQTQTPAPAPTQAPVQPPVQMPSSKDAQTSGTLTAKCEEGDLAACIKACGERIAAACTQVGLRYNRDRDLANAALYYERGCTNGDPVGCNNLGTLYQFGALGLAGDWAKAAALYERACDGGHIDACANLGSLYVNEPGASPSLKARGRELLQKACAAGVSRACAKH